MDWTKLIAELAERGRLTQAQIAERCGAAQSTVSDLARGTNRNPSWSVGDALKALHAEVMARPADQPATEVSHG